MEATANFDAWSGRVDEAAAWAARLHRGQYRAMTDIPYVTHLWAVASLVAEWGGNEDQVVAALLHEAARDGDSRADLGEIGSRFGPRVVNIVAECCATSDDTTGPDRTWEDRISARLARLRSASPEARLVACCDTLHNASSIVRSLRRYGWRNLERHPGGPDGVLWVYRGLAGVFRSTGGLPAELVRELERSVAEMAVLGKVDGSLTPLSGESLDEWSGRVASVARRVRLNGNGSEGETPG
jgi:hypothetical protein